MVSVLIFISSSSGLGLSLGQRHCVMFLGKTLYSHCASLHPGVPMGANKFNDGGKPCDRLASQPAGGSRNTLSHFVLQNSG